MYPPSAAPFRARAGRGAVRLHHLAKGGVADRELKQADDPCRVIEIVARAGQLYATLTETPYCDCTRYSKSAYAVQLR
jgi:hypothetical protein